MSKVFEAKYYKGSIVDNITNTSGVLSKGSFRHTEKGKALYFNSAGVSSFSGIDAGAYTSMNTDNVNTIIIWAKNVTSNVLVGKHYNNFECRVTPTVFSGYVGRSTIGWRQLNDFNIAHNANIQEWNQFIFVFDFFNKIVYFYCNGIYKGTTGTIADMGRSSFTDLFIGERDNYAGWITGYISKVEIRNTVPTLKEVQDDYKKLVNLKPISEPKRQFQLNKTLDLVNKRFDTVGPNIILDSGFDTGIDWTLGAGHSISGGLLNINSTGSFSYTTLTTNKIGWYRVKYTIKNYVSGSARVYAGNMTATYQSGNGTYIADMYSSVGGVFVIVANSSGGFVGSIDDVYAYELTGLIAAYNMKPVGNTLVDISGNGNTGTFAGKRVSSTNGLAFTGSEYVNLPSLINLGTSHSICIRFKPNALGTKSLFGEQASSNNFCYLNPMNFNYRSNSVTVTSSVITFTNNWCDLEIIRNGTSVLLYLDGIYVETLTVSNSNPLTGINQLFARQSVLGYVGDVQDLKIHNRVLTPKEIKAYHNSFIEQPYINEDFSDASADGTTVVPNGWTKGTGNYKVGEFVKSKGNLAPTGNFESGLVLIKGDADGSVSTWELNNANPISGSQDGKLIITTLPATQSRPIMSISNLAISTTQGKTYQFSFDYKVNSGTFILAAINNGGGGTISVNVNLSGNGTYVRNITAMGTSTSLGTFYVGRSLCDVQIDNFSLVEINSLPTFKQGTKYLECTTAGTLALPSNQAYGTWEFDWYKGADTNQPYFSFINSKIIDMYYGLGNSFHVQNNEAFRLIKTTGSNMELFVTPTSYIQNFTWYRVKITRTQSGVFTVYIKGGTFGNNWVLVSTGFGGLGTNPVTDNAYSTSNFFVLDLDTGDRFTNLLMKPGIEI